VRRRAALGAALLTGLALPAVPLVTGPLALPAARAAGACAPAVVAGTVGGGEWRSFGHDLSNTRSQELETGIGPTQAATLAPAWSFSVADGGSVTGTPVVADGCVFTGSDGGTVYAVNADTGDLVWAQKLPVAGGVNSSLTVDGGRVYGLESHGGGPEAFALDQATGAVLWHTQLDNQQGSDAYASPVVYNGMVFAGFSGGAAELSSSEDERYPFQGGFLLLDAATGNVIKKTWTIHPPKDPNDEFAGATIWSTGAVDTDTGFLYVGTGNPFNPRAQHENADAVIKVDLRTDSATFGQIVDRYQGTVDQYFGPLASTPCVDIPGNPPPWYPQGAGQCADIDLDFGASPNIFAIGGKKVVGAGQKSGVYHAFSPDDMSKPVWTSIVGAPSAVGGIVGTAALSGGSLVGPVTVPGGYLWSLSQSAGSVRWATPVGDGAHWGHQVSAANGVAYTTDTGGFLDAFDVATGAPLLHHLVGSGAAASLGAGVSIARHTVYAPAGGVVSAFRPSALPVPVPSAPVLPGGGGPAAAGPVVVSGPSAAVTGWATPVVPVPQGSGLTYVSADPIRHDVQALVPGPDTNPWCGAQGFPPGQCPLFWSPQIGVGGSTPVSGVASLPPGQYPFYCSLHPGMQGTVVVTAPPGSSTPSIRQKRFTP
jgi:polyvinyl alcohol dehydrogenase (cytochrome)